MREAVTPPRAAAGRERLLISAGLLALSAAALVALGADWRLTLVLFLAWGAEWINGAFGMGFGTLLVPALLWAGLDPVTIVSSVLATESLAGLAASTFHARDRNVDFSASRPRRALVLLSLGCAGGVALGVPMALALPRRELVLFTATIVILSGIVLLRVLRQAAFSQPKLVALSVLAAFNKSLTGGGFGPLLTTGQVLGGVEPKAAAGVTSFTKAVTGALGLGLYLSSGHALDLRVAGAMTAGALLAVPVATGTIRRMEEARVKRTIAWVAIALGAVTLVKALW